MPTIEQVQKALEMWKSGSTHGEIKAEIGLTSEEEFAITEVGYSAKMSAEQIQPRLAELRKGMLSRQIRAIVIQ